MQRMQARDFYDIWYLLEQHKMDVNFYVVRHPIEHSTHIQASMTLPTRPHAIFSTLQGTQNLDTKPTLQRAKNANAQPTHPS